MEVEQNHMVMSRRYGGQEGDSCYGHMMVSITNGHLLFVMGALIL